jgi:hypothetical protein
VTTRALTHEDDATRTYEVRDDKGNVIGSDEESKIASDPTVEDRLSIIEESIKSASSLADLKAKVEAGATVEAVPVKGK